MNVSGLERRGCFRLLPALGHGVLGRLLVAALLGCGTRSAPALRGAPLPLAAPVSVPASAAAAGWAPASASPLAAEPGELPLPGCSRYERSLLAAARAVAVHAAAGHGAWEFSEVVAELRAAGAPFVWPRLWTLQVPAFEEAQVQASLAAWLESQVSLGERRCGGARVTRADGGSVIAALVVDALADLDPLPARVRLGQWLRLRARLLTPARSAETALLGPRGAPRAVPTELRPGEVRSVFSLDQPGMWRVQLVLGTERGPRPALEAWVFVDEEPHAGAASAPAPGEELAAGIQASAAEASQRALLLELLNAARQSEQLPPVRRDPRLDALAQAHAEAMRASRQTAHDVGQGLPTQRLHEAGIERRLVGENVAYAASLGRAHRALWDSPAHRGTLLEPAFQAAGVGVAADGDGDAVWVCELFSN